MRKVKTFFHILSNSLLPQRAYYHKLHKTTAFFSFKYFVTLVFTLSLVFTIVLSFKLNPFKINSLLGNLALNLDKYPNDLIISINKGKLMTNYNRPYFLWLNSNYANKLLLVIDELATAKKINQYDAAVLITKNEVVFENMKNGDLKIIPMKLVDNETITKSTVEKVKTAILKIAKLILFTYPLLFLIAFLIILFVGFISNFLYLFVAAGTVYLFYHFMLQHKSKPKLVKIFQLSLHAVTLPILTNYFLGIFNLNSFPALQSLYLILVILFTAVAVHESYY